MARDYGQGSISYLKDRDVYVGRIRDGTKPNGKPNIVYFYGKTGEKRRDVAARMDEWRRQRKTGELPHDPSNLTVADGITDWLVNIKRSVLKPASYDRLESTIGCHIIPRIGGMRVRALTAEAIQTKLISDMSLTLGHSSVKKAYDAMNEYVKHLVICGELPRNPMAALQPPSKAKFNFTEIRILSQEEIGRITDVINSRYRNGSPVFRYGQAYLFMLNTGIRMGEALALRWDDVDFTNKRIRINKNAIMVKRRESTGDSQSKRFLRIQGTTKTLSGIRYVPLNHNAMASLRGLFECSTGAWVVSTKCGEPVQPSPFSTSLIRICKAADVEPFGLHTLRHTFATRMIEASVDIKTVSRILGHKSVKITYDLYVHVTDRVMADAVEAVSL